MIIISLLFILKANQHHTELIVTTFEIKKKEDGGSLVKNFSYSDVNSVAAMFAVQITGLNCVYINYYKHCDV